MKTQTIALDVYGTLIDTAGVLTLLKGMVGERAVALSDFWRTKQLEYSFRRGLMDRYVDFSIVTKEALQYSCAVLGLNLDQADVDQLMQQYRTLPAFEDARLGVKALKDTGHQVFAFSNGSRQAVTELLDHAGIISLLDGIISMEAVNTFKPSPVGYRYFCQSTATMPEDAWLVSGNNFDVIGARSYGMQAAWLRRNDNMVFDSMGFAPSLTISKLTDLAQALTPFFDKE